MSSSAPPTPVLITDSSCDLPAGLVADLGLKLVSLRFTIDGHEYVDDLGVTMSHAEFYRRMRAGAHPTTAAVPLSDYLDVFTQCAEDGRAALLLGLAEHLSSSHEAALTAASMVNAEHPGADIRVVDTVNASASLGFLVIEAAERVAEGYDIDAIERWAVDSRLRVNGYFTLDTLEHLRRGGRIPNIVAAAGTMLDVRPMLRIDGKGALVLAGQSRGRKKSIKALVDIAEQRAVSPASHRILVAHGDAAEDAETLRRLLRERMSFKDIMTTELGPVMAAHAGPGMLAVVFWAAGR
jgi:DegV family protein with EDD domain